MVCEKSALLESDSLVEAGRRLIAEADDDIVISGIAGDFPDSEGLTEFAEKLFNKVDLISDDDRRWKLDHPEIPQRTGKLKQVSKFDAASFGIHYNQAQAMDPMTRILLEKSYEAIADSGYNPYSLKGSKTGVFVGACFSESEKTWFYEKLQVDGFGITGCIRTMMANRISYAFGFDGPSYVVDTACSSSMYALEQGYNAIREGHCDAAIVAGCNLCLHPYVSLQFSRLGVLSMDGKCKVFDEAANGYCRSEAIAVIFLQKMKNSRRVYAKVVHVKTNCDGYKEQGITYPSGEMQQRLLEEFYQECMIDPSTLAWVEAHGTGTKVGDPEEVRALHAVICKNRKTPLKIGSVKSNLGHTEPSSGMCSIAKVIIAMESGLIPPNINFKTPRSDIEYFHTGEMEVVTEPTPWEGGKVGINSFGFGGANCHALLEWNYKSKVNGGMPDDDLPRLVNVSGRTVEAVDTLLTFLEKSSLDAEFVRLLHDIHKTEIPSHLYRGYTILTKNKSFATRNVEYFGLRRPLYIQFSGQCNKWKSFDKSLLQFPVFKQSLTKLGKIVSMDIVSLITNPGNVLSNPVEFFVSIVASQIALYDLLQFIGITADGFIGISLGNLVCAYADGCLTSEETILVAYNVALAYAKTSSTSGTSENSVWNISTSFLSSAKTLIVEDLRKVVKSGATNTSKWLNPSEVNGKDRAEFIYQSLVSSLSLNFDEDDFPEDYLMLNVGPKGTYEQLEFTVNNVLDSEGQDDLTSFLIAVGKLYMGGIESDIAKLYSDVQYPVSRSTPMIAPLIRWNHTDDWYVTSYSLQKKIGSGERTVSISLSDDETEFIAGHVVDGRNLFPATGYLTLVWETLGLIKGDHFTEVPVVFENVRFLRATNMSKDGSVEFTIIVQRASGNFEVVEGGAPIVTGRAYVPSDVSKEMSSIDAPIESKKKEFLMSSKDIYKELRLRGYNYAGLFRSLMGIDIEEKCGIIRWQKNWVAFMDNMLQIQIINEDTRGLFVPTYIEKVVIDGRKHVQAILNMESEEKDIAVYYHREAQIIKSGGVEFKGLRANAISRKKILAEAILEKYLFIPNSTTNQIYNLEEIMKVYTQIMLENEQTVSVKAVEVFDNKHSMLGPVIAQVLSELPLIQPEIVVLGTPEIPEDEPLPPEVTVEDKKPNTDQSALLVVANNVCEAANVEVLKSCLLAVKPGGFLIVRENLNAEFQNDEVTVLCSHVFEDEKILLLRKNKKVERGLTEVVHVSQDDYSWISSSQSALKSKECKRIVFVGKDGTKNGALGFVNCIRKEPEGNKSRCVLTMDENVPEFSLDEPFYNSQLSKDLAINVYKDGQWGTYRHIKLASDDKAESAHVYANTLVRGDISSLSWIKGWITDEKCFSGSGDFSFVHYSSLNFRDIMLASGKLAPEVVCSKRIEMDCVIGFEYSGVRPDGTRIMGLLPNSGLASVVEYDPSLSWKIPDGWSLEDAATVPCTYGTVLFALILRGRLTKGDTVLIHAGSGGVGQAAIQICLKHGCTVFTTVGTPEKRKFIKETYPEIDDRYIGNSRDTSFEQLVMHETNGRGVDIVLNSLAEEKLLASVRCLAKGGRFLEIGKFDLANNNPLGMEIFGRGASFHGILLDAFFNAEPEAKYVLNDLLKRFIEAGYVKPLCRHVFEMEEVETAFRFMAGGKHIGKVLVKIRDEETSLEENKKMLFQGVPRVYCDNNKSYIILGGLGGFGLELADWLVIRGARKIILTSRKGISNGYQAYRVKVWKHYGTDIQIHTDDITTRAGVESLLNKAKAMGPVAAIFNLAVVLKDAIFENQTAETFMESLGPKALATQYFDELSRKMCPELEHFVIFSSVSCGRGNAGQTNYGMANSVMERICERRNAAGLPGLAIQWGAVGDVGLVAEMMDENVEVVIGGTLQQRISSCLEVMDKFMTQNHPIVASMVVAEKKSGRLSTDNIVDTVVNILGIRDLKTVSFHSNLAELGMDSMMAVEIKQTLEREFEVFLSPQDIRGMTIAKLQEIASAKEKSDEKTGGEGNEEEPVTKQIQQMIQLVSEEPVTYEPIIKLRSGTTENATRVFLVPGLEGFPSAFEAIVKGLDVEAYCLQLDYTTFHSSIPKAVDALFPKLLPYLQDKTFNIVGYSFGGMIAIEIVCRLERLGYSGKLMLIDSTPDGMQRFARHTFSDRIDESLEIQSILRFFDNVMLPHKKNEIEDLLKESPGFDSKVEILINYVRNYVPFSPKFVKELANSFYYRLISILSHEGFPSKCLACPVTLIKPTDAGVILEDHGLSKLCKGPILEVVLEGNHLTILSNPKVPSAMNEFFNSNETVCSKTSILRPPTDIEIISEPAKQI